MKRALYINMLLRAYSQEVFLQTQLFERRQSEDEFVDEVGNIFKEFIAVGYQISQAVVKARVRKTLKVHFWSAWQARHFEDNSNLFASV